MKVYIDSDYRCHTAPGPGLVPAEIAEFNGKCSIYIQGYRFVPAGQSWTRSDGIVFQGEMIAPAEDIRILEAAQAAYEEAMAETADMQAALDAIYSGEVMV